MADMDWQVTLLEALDSGTPVVVSLDGVDGVTAYDQFMIAAQRGLSAGSSASPFNYEMATIYQLGKQATVTFIKGGMKVPNPF